MKVMLSTTPMNRPGGDYNFHLKGARPSTGMVYLGSMLGEQGKFGFGRLTGVDVMLEEPNISEGRFLKSLNKFGPDIFCFTPYEFNLERSKELCALVKALNPNTLVFVGGPLATIAPEYVGKFIHADAVFLGEADFTLREVVNYLTRGGRLEKIDVAGVLPMKKGKPIETANSRKIQTLTQAEYRMIEPDIGLLAEVTKNAGYEKMDFAFSRGCPSKLICSFCQLPATGNKALETGKIIGILKQIKQIPGIKFMCFGDAMFGNGKDGAIRLMKEITREGISFDGFAAEWSLDMLLKAGEKGKREADLEMLNLMKQLHIGGEIGLESLSESQLVKFNKDNYTYEEIKRVLSAVKDQGIITSSGIFLWGFDTTCKEVIETIERAFDLAHSLRRVPITFIDGPVPYMGTVEYAKFMEARKNGGEEFEAALVLMNEYGLVKKTSSRDYPVTLKAPMPLQDMLLQQAIVEMSKMTEKMSFEGREYPPLGLFQMDGDGDEAHLLTMLLAIKKVASEGKYPQSKEVLEMANRALDSIGKNKVAGLLADIIESDLC